MTQATGTGRLEGKVVFITGAGRGMGRSHAVRLAREGADIIGMDICGPIPSANGPVTTPEDLAETVRAVEALDRRMVTFQADVTDEEALTAGLAEGVAQLGRLDVAVANAGIGVPPHEVAETPAREWRDMLETNLTGVFLTAKAAIPHIRAHGEGGSIILISSALGLRGMPNVASYVAAKHGVVGLMRSLAMELAPERIPCQLRPPDERGHAPDPERERVPALPARPGAPDPGRRQRRLPVAQPPGDAVGAAGGRQRSRALPGRRLRALRHRDAAHGRRGVDDQMTDGRGEQRTWPDA